MQAASLGILERAQVPPLQAQAILEVIDIELAAQHGALATKQDLGILGGEIRRDLEAARHDLELKIKRIRGDLVRRVFACVLGQTAMLLGAAYFFAGHVAR
jgi:hypothetical protein